jgi:DNA-binding HxlR family transcriptional regulator
MVMGDARYLQRSRDLRHLLNGEWITHILVALSAGPLHYKDLHAAIQEMSTYDPWTGQERRIQGRALGRTLRRLETGGLVLRHEERVFPRSVVYSLTPAATDLLTRARPLIDWAEEHVDLIERLQRSQSKKKGHRPQPSDELPDDDRFD